VKAARARYVANSSTPELVAEVIYEAATDPSDRMRYAVGSDARRFIPLRRLLGAGLMMRMIKGRFQL
jgi:hypothetical protein